MKRRRRLPPMCGLRLWVFSWHLRSCWQRFSSGVTQAAQMSSTAVAGSSTLLEWITILRHSSHPCPMQDGLAPWHRPWEQVGQHWPFLDFLPRYRAAALGNDLLLIFISAASMASLTWPTTPTRWSTATVGYTGYLQLFIAALVPLKSPIFHSTIRTAPWHSGALISLLNLAFLPMQDLVRIYSMKSSKSDPRRIVPMRWTSSWPSEKKKRLLSGWTLTQKLSQVRKHPFVIFWTQKSASAYSAFNTQRTASGPLSIVQPGRWSTRGIPRMTWSTRR